MKECGKIIKEKVKESLPGKMETNILECGRITKEMQTGNFSRKKGMFIMDNGKTI